MIEKSSIKTEVIEGDLKVSRNINVGGKATIKGDVVIGHNLKVEGWLNAININSSYVGIFTNEDNLKQAYPKPKDGWYAGVGATIPFKLYVGEGGSWVGTDMTTDFAKGDRGEDGKDGSNGKDGTDGADGKSAYKIAVEGGYGGSEEEWLESLKGKDGSNGGIILPSLRINGDGELYMFTEADNQANIFSIKDGFLIVSYPDVYPNPNLLND